MDNEVKMRWLEALRSGKYQQGGGYLRQKSPAGDKFCCLGVLIDILDPNGWVDGQMEGVYEHDGRTAIPNLRIEELAGIERKNFASPDWYCRLPAMNDEGNKSFEEIADYIEENA